MIVGGAIAPHAPLLLEEVSGPEVSGACSGTIAATAAVDVPPCDALVLLSPHGRATGVYEAARGSLAHLGVPGVVCERPTASDLVGSLARGWRQPLLPEGIDHGALVPLSLLPPSSTPVVACCLSESSSEEEQRRAGLAFAEALLALAGDLDVFFVASLNTSAALTPRAPLLAIEGGRALDDAVLASLADGTPVHEGAWAAGGSCGAGPWAAFEALKEGAGARTASYEHPFGVGYLVAGHP